MADLFEYYNTGDDSESSIYGVNWESQTFIPSIAHKITSVKLLLFRGGNPATCKVSIRATDGSGHPTGNDLCSGEFSGGTLPTGDPYEWREITLGNGYDLEADTKYAIVLRATSGSAANYLEWRRDRTEPAYDEGCQEWSPDSGLNWTTNTARDYMFEDWGEPAGVTHELAGVIAGVAAVSGQALITRGIAGVAAGVCGVSGLALVDYKLAGVTAGVCGVSGAASLALKLAGVSAGAASVAGALLNIKWLAGVISGKAYVSGQALITRGLAGVVAGVCSVTGNLLNIKWLAGVIAGVATVTGDLFHVRVAIRVLSAVRNLLAVRNIPPVR